MISWYDNVYLKSPHWQLTLPGRDLSHWIVDNRKSIHISDVKSNNDWLSVTLISEYSVLLQKIRLSEAWLVKIPSCYGRFACCFIQWQWVLIRTESEPWHLRILGPMVWVLWTITKDLWNWCLAKRELISLSKYPGTNGLESTILERLVSWALSETSELLADLKKSVIALEFSMSKWIGRQRMVPTFKMLTKCTMSRDQGIDLTTCVLSSTETIACAMWVLKAQKSGTSALVPARRMPFRVVENLKPCWLRHWNQIGRIALTMTIQSHQPLIGYETGHTTRCSTSTLMPWAKESVSTEILPSHIQSWTQSQVLLYVRQVCCWWKLLLMRKGSPPRPRRDTSSACWFSRRNGMRWWCQASFKRFSYIVCLKEPNGLRYWRPRRAKTKVKFSGKLPMQSTMIHTGPNSKNIVSDLKMTRNWQGHYMQSGTMLRSGGIATISLIASAHLPKLKCLVHCHSLLPLWRCLGRLILLGGRRRSLRCRRRAVAVAAVLRFRVRP